MTYIPKQPKLIRERLEAKLEQGLMQRLAKYCAYLDSDRDYVISQALEVIFRKDKGFAEWLKSSETESIAGSGVTPATSRRRRGPVAGHDAPTA